MCMMMQGGTFLFLHAVVILVISFFVVVVARKQDAQAVKAFGYVIAVLLWLGALGVFFKSAKVFCPFNKFPRGEMGCQKKGMNMQGDMPMPDGMMQRKMAK